MSSLTNGNAPSGLSRARAVNGHSSAQPINIGGPGEPSSLSAQRASTSAYVQPGSPHSPPAHYYPIASASPPATNSFAAMNLTDSERRRSISQTMNSPNGGLSTTVQAQAASPQSASSQGLQSGRSPRARAGTTSSIQLVMPKPLRSFNPQSVRMEEAKIVPRILLLENVNETGIQLFRAQGYHVDTEKGALGEDELIERLIQGRYTAVGIRSKTRVTAKVIEAVRDLLVIGCFCIGTNQVDLRAAAKAGIAVFNSPFSNSRSVAELVISEVIALSRQICDRSNEMRKGTWNKVSKGCWEVRNKTLGIVGYGHIGSQLSVLAEAMGLNVLYFDVMPIMPLGQARQVDTLDELLSQSDFVTLHVPELPETTNMISHDELQMMKEGSYLLNNARGKVVDLDALAVSIRSGHLAGAAIDVYPSEPAKNGQLFNSNSLGGDAGWAEELGKLPNVILTPHIGGSTEEAQRMIGTEVASALVRYVNFGSSLGAVNFPEVSLRPIIGDKIIRVCHIHANQPGVLKRINAILGEYNVERQLSDSRGDLAYLMADIADVDQEGVRAIYEAIQQTPANIATRVLL
ncbi:uncharacterized protein L969DRAFT_103892 [Mixia osmundae IAM 14324]|uniref:Phosphoglycerate dehydrogenase n=1 Tax=Mixia osmundae (strain CBS 9802 / IAM 14324 / JCM 22182 / KY 12970) TaxID=764103 RepID=G7E8K1_MIXOS|nr:uncharacterized protein L969DRAFT_103892 [Mixia osmundae IAM 14324]KEI38902.1 hypothetical protein L969DRAFT_103892 [Mixia osmundae IAM 14324]GAA99161.1 hypothetical protein E5Q_05853 [Mixia osmundae IAM 14324]